MAAAQGDTVDTYIKYIRVKTIYSDIYILNSLLLRYRK